MLCWHSSASRHTKSSVSTRDHSPSCDMGYTLRFLGVALLIGTLHIAPPPAVVLWENARNDMSKLIRQY